VLVGDAEGLVELAGGEDELSWCGTPPLYSLLRSVPGLRGDLLAYDQWNIDEGSVVTFAALAFRRGGA
jgi:hypothetical protein